jgi:class 3 adenylate cyclase
VTAGGALIGGVIEGSTAMAGRLGDAWAEVLADYHRLVQAGLAAHGGEEVVSQADGAFVVFASPRECLDAVIQVQRALVSHAWPTGERVLARMGIHNGEASGTPTGLAGVEVQRAARIAGVAHGARWWCRPRRPGCWPVRCRLGWG